MAWMRGPIAVAAAMTALAATGPVYAGPASGGSVSVTISDDTGQVTRPPAGGELVHRAPAAGFKPSAAYRWLEILLAASGRDAVRNRPRPTILSRTQALVLTAMYDAWAAYDAKAVGTRLGAKLRRPAKERTLANKEKAIAYAAYRALLFVYAEDADWIREQLRKQGHDPDDASTNPNTPAGVGNLAAAAVIEFRSRDGSNQLGDEAGAGKPYADTTAYAPVNSTGHVVDPLRWMPIPFSDGNGGTVSPGFLTPHWGRVRPFAMTRGDQFRPPEPPKWGSPQLEADIVEVATVNAALTLEQKAIVEFMREGPRSTGQSGHWLQFAQDVSRRDRNDLDRDVKLFFAVANVVMDAFIACWDAKRHYDTSRPYWWVRHHYQGKRIRAWVGPGKGVALVPGESWRPYSPDIFLTPPFPGYPSGHATASGAAARILERMTGSDRFGAVAYQQAGHLTGEARFTSEQMQAIDGKPARAASKLIRLALPTFTATAEMAAMSRLLGGYHIRTDNDEGLILGRRIADHSWPIYEAYFDGTRRARPAKR
jgi:hypothetical protein